MPQGDIPILSDVFGATPDVAPYIPTDFSAEQLKALTENIGAFPDITQLGDLYQQYMLADLNKVMPGFSDLLASGTADAAAIEASALPLIKGELPQDVKDQVLRSSAFQALQGGFQGSPMAGALTARDLGLTSLNLMNQGANLAQAGGNAAQRWAGLADQTILNPSSMLITPQQQAALTMQNNLYKQQTQQLQNNLNAAPDPVAKGISDTIINLVGAYLGKGGGGGGTAPNYSPMQDAGQQQQFQVQTFGGTNPYTATTGGFNFAGSNYGGTDIPYLGGNVSTPYGAAYGTGESSAFTQMAIGNKQIPEGY